MLERGDKLVTLPERLETIEKSIERLEARVNRLFGMLGLLVTITNAPQLADMIGSLVRSLR